LVAGLSVVWVAFSLFTPYGFPWTALGWVGLALSAALWQVSSSSTRSISQILSDIDAQPVPAMAPKPRVSAPKIGVLVACLGLWPALSFAGTPDPANLAACKSGSSSCDRGRLTLVEITEVALAGRARNVSNCKNGLKPCAREKLNKVEAIAVAVALYDRNVSNCLGGLNPCDHSQLAPSEARETAVALHHRQLSDCKDGIGSCDPSTLTELELAEVVRALRRGAVSDSDAMASAERSRNYTACLNRSGYCDRSRLTPSEAALIPAEVR
jgi:hypothetical protein